MTQPDPKPFGSHYLHFVHIDSYGSFSQRDVGPFAEGLNVVYGANEAGKTTTSSFIGGVLFGWEDARSGRNTYRPATGERSGTLVFSPREGATGEDGDVVCSRSRNADGIKPDPETFIVSDIEKDTFRTMFSLDSDQLTKLERTSDVTAHLLTAGAGTATSPAHALAELDSRISDCFSHSGNLPDSIPNILLELERVNEQIDQAALQARQFKEERREYAQLAPQRDELAARIGSLNGQIEGLSSSTADIKRISEAVRTTEQDLEEAKRDAQDAERALASVSRAQASTRAQLDLDEVQARFLREELDELSAKQTAAELEFSRAQDEASRAELAYQNAATSERYEHERASLQRRDVFAKALSVVLPLTFGVLALFLFMQELQQHNIAVAAGAILCVIAAIATALVVPFVLLRTSDAEGPAQQDIRRAVDALDAAQQELTLTAQKREQIQAQVDATLAREGLESAGGNIRHAKGLIDDSLLSRANTARAQDQFDAAIQRKESLEAALAASHQELQQAYAAAGFEPGTPIAELAERQDALSRERDRLQADYATVNARYGELGNELAGAKNLQDFDRLKIYRAQLDTRLDEAKADYARLLLSRKVLAQAIGQWERKSQPEVYRQAGRLLSTMTGSNWVKVELGDQDKIVVFDAFGNERAPQQLSLGTLQQLYLALRIALLLAAENVGSCIPVIADDILVNFDATRRVQAARALAELAQVRQVIVFTCHEEVVSLMQDTCGNVNLVEL